MKTIEGFQSAKSVLSRQAPVELYPVSPALRQRLKELFAVDAPELVVKQIVESYGGKVSVTSREGEGTTVSFELPIRS